MWREFIKSQTPEGAFKAPASAADIAAVEKALGLTLPSELAELLRESDGVNGEYQIPLVWPTHRIAADNIQFRTAADFKDLYMPFDCLLFFADAGNGAQFAYAIRNAEVRTSDIYAWNHEDDSRTWVAPSLNRYIEWWLSGKISI